jgi:hypothetical protein
VWKDAVEDENDPAISEALPYWAADSEDPKSDIFDAMYFDVQDQVSLTVRKRQHLSQRKFSADVTEHTL